MKFLLSLLALFALLLTPHAARAQTPDPLGTVEQTFTIAPTKVLADPGRNQVYAILPSNNTLAVISTQTLQVTGTINVGSVPVDMAISADDATLYIANNGGNLGAVTIVDIDTLTPTGRFSLPAGFANAIAADATGDVYVAALVNLLVTSKDGTTSTFPGIGTIYEFNSPFDAPPTSFGPSLPPPNTAPTGTNVVTNYLTISPNGSALYTAGSNGTYRYDVSTGKPGKPINNTSIGTTATQLIISHNGFYLCAPQPGGDTALSPPATIVVEAPTLFDYYGVFSAEAAAGPLEFSLDDKLVYQVRGSVASELDEFSTTTFAELATEPLPSNTLALTTGSPVSVALDNTGSYLFIGERVSTATDTAGQLLVVSTGQGTLNVPAITSSLTATGIQDAAFVYQIVASNSATTFDASGLPAGLAVDRKTGVISGAPTASGTFDVLLSATNANGTGTATLVLTITPLVAPPVITTTTLPNAVTNQFYSAQIVATNEPRSYGATGLPTNLTIDPTTGLISGTPINPGTFAVVVSATNSSGTGTATLSLTITGAAVVAPVINSNLTAATNVDAAFTYAITATNSPTSYGSSSLPPGLSLDPTTGLITGAVTEPGTYAVIISATNAAGTGTATLLLSVPAVPTPVISPPYAVTATVNQPFSYQIVASNQPVSYTASDLPPGLTIDTTTGLISGTPLASGTFSVALSATNVDSTGTATLALTIASGLPTVTLMATVPTVTAGTGDHGAVTINRTGDLSNVLIVAYQIKGSAVNGVDYVMLSGRKKIRAGRSSATIQIIPAGSGNVTKDVKLVLLPAVTYDAGDRIKAKVKILDAGE